MAPGRPPATMRLRLRLTISLILVLMTADGCVLLTSRTAREAASIVGEDGDRVLRKPMRPIRGETRVIVVALDGVGHDAFIDALRSGRMPRTAAFLGSETESEGTFEHAYSAPNALSVLPSSTTAAWTSIFTGVPPGESGVPGNEWFDRAEGTFYAPNPVSTDRRYQVLASYNEDRLGRLIRVPTLFERTHVRSHVSMLHVYRGADMINIPEIEPFGSLFDAALAGVVESDSAEHRFYEKLDEVSIRSLDESLDRYGVADLQVVYFPGIDLFTHIAASPVHDQQRYLERVIDPAIGEVFDRYDRERLLDDTYVLIISDHGQTPVLPERGSALQRGGEASPARLLDKAGFRVRPRSLKIDDGDNDFQAVLAMQGGMAFVYLADRSTCPSDGAACDWSQPPRVDDDLLPAARAFARANRSGELMPEMQGTMDLILARPRATPENEDAPFQVFDGDRLVPIDTYLAAEPRTDLLALQRRLGDLATGPYGYLAGDILLLSRMRLDEPVESRAYFGEPYFTWHGSANAEDSRIVFVLAHREHTGSEMRNLIRDAGLGELSQMHATQLILRLLSR